METPVKKKRRRTKRTNQLRLNTSMTAASNNKIDANFSAASNAMNPAATSAGDASPSRNAHPGDMADPFLTDAASHPYQYATEIDTSNENVTANDGLDYLFQSIEQDPGPNNVFHESHKQPMFNLLQDYSMRGPSPTQGNDDDWANMMNDSSTSAILPTCGPQLLVENSLPTLESSPGLTTDTANTIDIPTTNVFAASATSPATPRSASRYAPRSAARKPSESLGKRKRPLNIPKTPQFAAFHPAGTPLQEEPGYLTSDGDDSGEYDDFSAEEFPEPREIRRKGSKKKSLGSPFQTPNTPASAPARQFTASNAMADMFGSPIPVGNRHRSMNNMPVSTAALQGQIPLVGPPMRNMTDPRSRSMSVNFKSPPNPATFMDKLLNNNLLESGTSSPQQHPAKRIRVDPFRAQDILANIAHEQQIRRQASMQSQQVTEEARSQLGFAFNSNVQDWIDSQQEDPSPRSTMAQTNEFAFSVPLPSGTVISVKQETEDDVNVGQNGISAHMMQGDPEASDFQGSFGTLGQGYAQTGDEFPGLFIPQAQGQSPMRMQAQRQLLKQNLMQSQMGMQARGQFSPTNQMQSPLRMGGRHVFHGHRQGQSQPQTPNRSRSQSQGQFSQASPSPQVRNSHQQQRQVQQTTPQVPITTPKQVLRSSPRDVSTGQQGSSTPEPRRRSALSRPDQNIVASSLQADSPRLRDVQNTPSKKRVRNQDTAVGSPQTRTPIGNAQTPNARSFNTPIYLQEQFQASTQTSNETPPTQTPTRLRAHLPTPQQPISTGSCPNTVNETLEETNRRTEAQLRAHGAPVVNYDPNFNLSSTIEDILAYQPSFKLPNNVAYEVPGFVPLSLGNENFTDLMGADMSLNMGLAMNMSPTIPTEVATGSGNAANLENTLLNTDARATSVGYAETIVSETAANIPTHTPVHTALNGVTGAPGNRNIAADAFILTPPPENDVTVTVTANPFTADGAADMPGMAMPEQPNYELDWSDLFDEGADFNEADWGL